MNSAFVTPTASLDDPLYYLTNFRFVLAWVGERHADLLAADELAFVEQFESLPKASQALLVRMVMRKGELFRLSKLSYAEVGDSAAAMAPLIALGWVDSDEDADQLTPLMLITEYPDETLMGEPFVQAHTAQMATVVAAYNAFQTLSLKR